MSTSVDTGWLKNNNGDKFAPKTLTSQVINSDGISIEQTINQLNNEKVDKIDLNYVTPQMYGAKGDGITNDTEAFITALAENDKVFVPEGIYNISSALNLINNKSLYSDSGRKATLRFIGTSGDIIQLGHYSKFVNIDIDIPNYMVGNVFNTDNRLFTNTTSFLHTLVSGVDIMIHHHNSGAEDKDLTVINIVASNQTGANGFCYQTYSGINVLCPDYYHVDHYVDSFAKYSTGIKALLTADEAGKTSTSWITHLNFKDIYLGGPITAVRVGIQNNSGVEEFTKKCTINNVLLTNVSAQVNANYSERFLDVDHCKIRAINLKSWDYSEYAVNKKFNIIGEGARVIWDDDNPPVEHSEFPAGIGSAGLSIYQNYVDKYFSNIQEHGTGLALDGSNEPRYAYKLMSYNGPNIDEITNIASTLNRTPELISPSIYRMLGKINVGTSSNPISKSGIGLQLGTGSYHQYGGHCSKQVMFTNDMRMYFRQYYSTTSAWQPWVKVYTETDKQEIIDMVLNKLPIYNGEVE